MALPNLGSLVGPDGNIPRGALANQLRQALGGSGHGPLSLRDNYGGGGSGGLSSSGSLATIDGGLAGTDLGGSSGLSPDLREKMKMAGIGLTENHNGGGSCGSEVSTPRAGGPLLPGTGWSLVVWAHPPYSVVSMTEPWMRALGLPLEESVQCLPLEQALGRNPTDDYTILKGAMSRREDIEIPSLTLTSLAGVPNLSYAINAQPLRDTEGGVKCYLLEVTPHPEVHHLALLTEIEESTVKGKGKQKLCPTSPGDPSALPLVAAASQGSPLPTQLFGAKGARGGGRQSRPPGCRRRRRRSP